MLYFLDCKCASVSASVCVFVWAKHLYLCTCQHISDVVWQNAAPMMWCFLWPECVCVCVFTGSEMWLCYHPHGSVLVYRVYASGCDCPTASRPLPYDGHHGGWSGTVLIFTFLLHYVPAYMCLYSIDTCNISIWRESERLDSTCSIMWTSYQKREDKKWGQLQLSAAGLAEYLTITASLSDVWKNIFYTRNRKLALSWNTAYWKCWPVLFRTYCIFTDMHKSADPSVLLS